MKTIGFLTLHDHCEEAQDLNDLIKSTRVYTYLDKIIEYLKLGHDFADTQLLLDDDEGKPMFGLGYQTDGEWIWPNYFPYYLKKYPNYEIDKEFIEYLNEKSFLYTEPNESQRRKASDYFFINIW